MHVCERVCCWASAFRHFFDKVWEPQVDAPSSLCLLPAWPEPISVAHLPIMAPYSDYSLELGDWGFGHLGEANLRPTQAAGAQGKDRRDVRD